MVLLVLLYWILLPLLLLWVRVGPVMLNALIRPVPVLDLRLPVLVMALENWFPSLLDDETTALHAFVENVIPCRDAGASIAGRWN